MKRIKRRSSAALLLAFLVMAGTGVLFFRLLRNGATWAAYSANSSVYTDRGVLDCGTLTDRSGLVLAHARQGVYGYADDAVIRTSSVHAVGDYRGYIGTSALSAYAGELTGYTTIRGTTRPGNTVALSLDVRLQTAAWAALSGRTGAVMVMNYETGEVLCMVSNPSYDPNGEADESIEGLFVNRALSAAYTPGSVFKLVTLAAAIENIDDLYERSFPCAGSCEVAGVTVNCAGVHGAQTIEQALANSCNCAFAELSLELGGDTLAQYARDYGFTRAHYLDTVLSAAGTFEAVQEADSYLAWSGIGQHTDLICPYTMLRFCAAVANGGVLQEPTMLLGKDNGKSKLIKAATAEELGEMMDYTVDYNYSQTLDIGTLPLCAKSGTAELGDETSHAWFTGYLHSGAPLAFVVVLERGGGGLSQAGSVALPVLNTAWEYYKE